VDKIVTGDVLSVLKPHWNEKPETASRLRGRIERITRGHYAAMHYGDVPTFMTRLRSKHCTAALALEFVVLTAARCGEAVGARWQEFDLENAMWTVPVSRMKAGREHRVPLSQRALTILKVMREHHDGDFVFPSARHFDKSLAVRTLWRVIRGMQIRDATVHGFRSAFRDWAAECINFPSEVCEAALAHSVAKVEAAYRRGDLFEKRRKLMEAWAIYCVAPKAGKVVAFRR
jgi:integrase